MNKKIIFGIGLLILLMPILVNARTLVQEETTRDYAVYIENDGTRTLEVDGNVKYFEDKNNKWKKVNTTIDKTNYEISDHYFNLKFEKGFTSDNLIIVNKDGHTVSFKPIGIFGSNWKKEAGTVQGRIISGNNIVWWDAFGRDIDIAYSVENDGVRKKIFLRNKNALGNLVEEEIKFSFKITTDYDIKDKDTKAKWNKQRKEKHNSLTLESLDNFGFHIDEGVVTDKSGRSTKVTYELERIGNEQRINLIVPSNFLNTAIYPVEIDPPLILDANTTTLTGNQTYDYVIMRNGGNITIGGGSNNLFLNVTDNMTMDAGSFIHGDQVGPAGGNAGSTDNTAGQDGNPNIPLGFGNPSGGGYSGTPNNCASGGAGGGAYGTGGTGGGSGACGTTTGGASSANAIYQNLSVTGAGGSGGGVRLRDAPCDQDGYSNAGGGLMIIANNTDLHGQIRLQGGAGAHYSGGSCLVMGGSGGSSGGNVVVHSRNLNISYLTILQGGGNGQDAPPCNTAYNGAGGGGGGSGGWTTLYYLNFSNTSTTITQSGGGAGVGCDGGASGGSGAAGITTYVYDRTLESNNAPTIPNLTAPPAGANLGYNRINFTWNASTDPQGDAIHYNWTISTTNDFSTYLNVSDINLTSINYTVSTNNTYFWRVMACDYNPINPACNTTWSTTRNFTVDTSLLEGIGPPAYNLYVMELTNQSYRINATFNNLNVRDVTSAFRYNNTLYSTNRTLISNATINATYEFLANLITPAIEAETLNKTFFWNFSISPYSGGTVYVTSNTFQQNISRITFQQCTYPPAAGLNISLEFNFFDEENRTQLFNNNFEGTFQLYGNTSTGTNYREYNTTVTNTTTVYLCIGTGQTAQTNAIIQYSRPGYDRRFYYLTNTTINNQVQNISLFELTSALGSLVNVYVQNSEGTPLQSYGINVQRYYIGRNSYETVSGGMTDELGKDSFFLRMNDVYYRFLILRNTTAVYLSDRTKITSENIYITIAEDTFAELLEQIDGIDNYLTYTNSTRIFEAFYNDGTGSGIIGCLIVDQMNLSTNSQICNTCSTSSSNTLQCTIPENPRGVYRGTLQITKGGTTTNIQTRIVDFVHSRDNFGLDGIMYAILIIILFATMGLYNPSVAVGLSLFGAIVSYWFGFITGVYGALISMIIIGVIVIVKMRT